MQVVPSDGGKKTMLTGQAHQACVMLSSGGEILSIGGAYSQMPTDDEPNIAAPSLKIKIDDLSSAALDVFLGTESKYDHLNPIPLQMLSACRAPE